jgi:bifunctional non-homologous end joining protein LigD
MSFDFCIPTKATTVPDGEDWLHEIKYDRYRAEFRNNEREIKQWMFRLLNKPKFRLKS